MKPATHKYANAYADGGMAKKKKKMKKPKQGKPIGKPMNTGKPPGGAYTPGAKGTYPMADGGEVEKEITINMANGGKANKKKAKKPDPVILGTGTAASAGKAISARQRRIDKALEDAGA